MTEEMTKEEIERRMNETIEWLEYERSYILNKHNGMESSLTKAYDTAIKALQESKTVYCKQLIRKGGELEC